LAGVGRGWIYSLPIWQGFNDETSEIRKMIFAY